MSIKIKFKDLYPNKETIFSEKIVLKIAKNIIENMYTVQNILTDEDLIANNGQETSWFMPLDLDESDIQREIEMAMEYLENKDLEEGKLQVTSDDLLLIGVYNEKDGLDFTTCGSKDLKYNIDYYTNYRKVNKYIISEIIPNPYGGKKLLNNVEVKKLLKKEGKLRITYETIANLIDSFEKKFRDTYGSHKKISKYIKEY